MKFNFIHAGKRFFFITLVVKGRRALLSRRVRDEMLDPAFPWTAYGNLTLLANPFLYQVRLTTKKTLPELEGEIAAAVEKARHGMVPVSGFISPGEKEFFRRLLAEPNTRWVKMLPYGLAPRYDPSVEDSRHLAEGRELILSAFPTSVPSSPISRANCLAMNDRIAALCARAGELGARRAGEHGFGGAAPEPPPRGAAVGRSPATMI